MHPGLMIRGALVKRYITSEIFPSNVHEFQLKFKEEVQLERATLNRLKIRLVKLNFLYPYFFSPAVRTSHFLRVPLRAPPLTLDSSLRIQLLDQFL